MAFTIRTRHTSSVFVKICQISLLVFCLGKNGATLFTCFASNASTSSMKFEKHLSQTALKITFVSVVRPEASCSSVLIARKLHRRVLQSQATHQTGSAIFSASPQHPTQLQIMFTCLAILHHGTARHNGVRNFVKLGRCQHKHHMTRRLFQYLEECVECLCCQHVHSSMIYTYQSIVWC